MSGERWIQEWHSRAKSGLDMGDEVTRAVDGIIVGEIGQGEGTE